VRKTVCNAALAVALLVGVTGAACAEIAIAGAASSHEPAGHTCGCHADSADSIRSSRPVTAHWRANRADHAQT
jgi:hypothetical protein